MIIMILFLSIGLLTCLIALANTAIKYQNAFKQIAAMTIANESLQKAVSEESKQRALYQARCLELEDAIKEGVGVSLRNEVTRVNCVFDENEMATIIEGTRHLIREHYQSTSGVRFYIDMIEKVEKNLKLMIKEREDKPQQ